MKQDVPIRHLDSICSGVGVRDADKSGVACWFWGVVRNRVDPKANIRDTVRIKHVMHVEHIGYNLLTPQMPVEDIHNLQCGLVTPFCDLCMCKGICAMR